ncbi:fibronectin type 3 and ankyrin repeat domains 1 protein [Tribolium madens]|uniref:fibronectin type 3 and ankyrin repeat domains 1 protein n=1 Tax=Tribolium madens TaxID=41895 RepID=UPI001CF72299|nr:fibronectin type 3 and ankyrin repeat domains 1 protein [Tribolium madens]
MALNQKPVMINRGQNHVIFSWNDIKELNDFTCVVQMLNELKEWVVIYWGPKNEVKVKDLAPCTCYDFRIKPESSEKWTHFKGATLDSPYMTMHFTRAIKTGKTPLIRKIAHARPILLEVENKYMKTPLVQAIEKNDPTLVNFLITLGANINTPAFYTKKSPLAIAVSLGHLSVAHLLVDKGCDTNTTDINGLTLLHHAVDSDNIESVKFALKIGLCVDAKDCNGWTPLMRAAILSCSDEIVTILLENGASKSLKDKNGFDFAKHKFLANKK